MQQLMIPFTLKNLGLVAVNVILIGATAFASSSQKGRVLTDEKFSSEDGTADIEVTGVPEGHSLATMQEFIAAYENTKVSQIKVKSDSLKQATQRFTEKLGRPVPPDQTSVIPAVLTLGEGADAQKVVHTLSLPYYTAPNKSLCVMLEPGVEVTIEMYVQLAVDSL